MDSGPDSICNRLLSNHETRCSSVPSALTMDDPGAANAVGLGFKDLAAHHVFVLEGRAAGFDGTGNHPEEH